MRAIQATVLMCLCSVTALAQCGFKAEPVSVTTWYRSEGWQLPGTRDGKAIRPVEVTINGKRAQWPEGVTVSKIEHDRRYRVTFPAAVFEEDGKPKKMRERVLRLDRLLRWEIDGKPYAYSYILLPEGLLCFFSVDVVDDKGDGVFRAMIIPGNIRYSEPPSLPTWAKKPRS